MSKGTLARNLLAGNKPSATPPEGASQPDAASVTPKPDEGGAPPAGDEGKPPAEGGAPAPDGGTPPVERNADEPVEEKGGKPADDKSTDTASAGAQPGPAKDPKVEAPAETVVADLSDEDLLALLKKRKGIDVASLDDLKPATKEPTPEERTAAEEEFQAQAREFGLKTKEYNAQTLNQFYKESARDARDIALEVFTAEQREINPEITDQQAEGLFADLYYETEPDDDPRRLAAGKRMTEVAKSYLNNKYKEVVGVTEKYKVYQDAQRIAKAYRGTVEGVAGSFEKELTFEVLGKDAENKDKTFSYKFQVPTDAIDFAKDRLLSEDMFAKLGESEMNQDFIKAAMRSTVIQKELPRIIATVADAHAAAVLAESKLGRRSIPVDDPESSDTRQDVKQPYQGQARRRLQQATSQ